MYSGMYFKAFCLQTTVGGCRCYMLGGISKVNTLMAAYEFTSDKEVKKMAKGAELKGNSSLRQLAKTDK